MLQRGKSACRSAKPVPKLTDLTITRLPEGMHWDTTLRAFGIRVGKHAKTFLVVKNGGHRIKIGRYPALSLQYARKRARRLLLDADTTQPSLTFHEAYTTYLETYIKPNYRPQPAYELQRLIEKHCRHLFAQPLSQIQARNLQKLFAPETPRQSNYLFGVLRTFFRWAERRDLCTSPLARLGKPYKETARDRLLTDDEIRAIWQATDAVTPFNCIVRLCITTGQRKGALAQVRPEWVHEACIHFPKHVMKNNTEHLLPIGPLTRSVLATHPYQPFNGFSKAKAALDRRSGVTDWVLHDCRRFFSSTHAAIGTPLDITEWLLHHHSGSRTPLQRTYDRHDRMPQATTAMTNYEAALSRILGLAAPSATS
jgi:integrase